MRWKLQTPWWKCLEQIKWCFVCHLLKKYAVKRVIVVVNEKNKRWRNNSTAWIGILCRERQKTEEQKENSNMNEWFSGVKWNYICWLSKTPWCLQFSWHTLAFYHGENVFNGKKIPKKLFLSHFRLPLLQHSHL